MTSTVDYRNSSLPICINLQLGQGCGLNPSQNTTFIDISNLILSEQSDVLITTKPTTITQLTFSDVSNNPFSVPLLDGSTVTVWQCVSSNAYEICAAKYDKNNNRLLLQRVINTDTNGVQEFPTGLLLSDGRLLISWQSNLRAKAKILFSDLSTSVDEFYAASAAGGGPSQLGSAQAILSDGRAVFLISTLQSTRSVINGTVLDLNTQNRYGFSVSSSLAGFQQGPSVVALPDGGFVGFWYGIIQGNSYNNILMQRFDSNITKVGEETPLTADSNGVQLSPFAGEQFSQQVAINAEKICVIWTCALQGRNSLLDICLNVYDSDLAFIKTIIPLNSYTTNDNRSPYIVSLSTGGFRASWRSYVQGSTFSLIFTVLLDDTASKIGLESRVNTNADSLSNNVQVTASSLDGYGSVITWAGSSYVYKRKYNSQITVEALGGNDTIEASGAGDTLNCGSGSDLLNYTGILSSCTIDLTTGKGCGEDLISECENIITSQFGDTITCNGNNIIYGGLGNDVVTIMGLPVTVYGGGGRNEVSFVAYNKSLTLDLIKGTGTDGYSNVTLYNVATVRGSNYGDYIVAGGTIYGGNGTNTMVVVLPVNVYGGSGVDTVSFKLSTNAVEFDLTANTGTDGFKAITSSSIENVICSPFGDTITGNAQNNIFYPGASRDALDGMGGSKDKVSYQNSPEGVEVNLRTGRGIGGDARGDTYSNIEHIIGSPYNDKLIGDDIDNAELNGGAGDDILTPGDGVNTVLTGGAGVDIFNLAKLKGSVIISDFEINNKEIIDLTGFTDIHSIKDLKMREDLNGNSTSTIIALNADAEVTLANVAMNSLVPAHFDFAPAPSHVSTVNPAWIAFGITAFGAVLGLALTIYRGVMSKEQMTLTKMQREQFEREQSSKQETYAVKPVGSGAKLHDSAMDGAEVELA